MIEKKGEKTIEKKYIYGTNYDNQMWSEMQEQSSIVLICMQTKFPLKNKSRSAEALPQTKQHENFHNKVKKRDTSLKTGTNEKL